MEYSSKSHIPYTKKASKNIWKVSKEITSKSYKQNKSKCLEPDLFLIYINILNFKKKLRS